MPVTVLLATDKCEPRNRLDSALDSLDLTVRRVDTGEEALRLHRRLGAGLVVVSTDLPDLHALDICRRIRRDSDVPLMVLACDCAEFDRVLALELGADDVVGETCGAEELQERVKAALRRGAGVELGSESGEVLDFDSIVLDRSTGSMTVRGEARALTPMETELMWMLCEHAGEVVTSEALLEDVWGYPPGIKTRTLDVHIGRLRKKLGEDGRNPRHIITVRSVGYRFDPPSRDEDEEDDVAA